MRAVLIFVILVAAATASPTGTCESSQSTVTSISKTTTCTYSTTSLPPMIPKEWKIKSFSSQYATIAFQKKWYVQSISATRISGLVPQKCGFVYNVFPCTCLSVFYYDTTPLDAQDFNINYHMVESSYNLITRKISTIKSMLTPAYPNSDLAMFNAVTQTTYNQSIKETNPFTDATMQQCTKQEDYVRYYTFVVLGCDDNWSKYMLCAIVNTYENDFSGPDDHILMLLTRKPTVSPDVYRMACDDINNSGLNPYNMINVNHSIKLQDIPTVSQEDIDGVMQKTTVQTEKSSTSVSTDSTSSTGTVSGTGNTVTKSTSTTTDTTTTVSSIGMVARSDFTTQYKFETYKLVGNVKVITDFTYQDYGKALSGSYYMQAASPFSATNCGTPGYLNTVFPLGSPQMCIDNTGAAPWTPGSQYMVIERNYNILSGKEVLTRKIAQLPYNDGTVPYATVLFYSEKFSESTVTVATPFSYDNVNIQIPNSIYTEKSMMSIVAYKENQYMILISLISYTNRLTNKPINPLYVYTRSCDVSQQLIDDITQELYRAGYQPNDLIYMDQSNQFDSNYTFEKSYFYPGDNLPSIPSAPTNSLSTRSNIQIDTSDQSTLYSSPSDYPIFVPKEWQVRVFEDQLATQFLQGCWNVQATSLTRFKNTTPITTGVFASPYPSNDMKIFIQDTTPSDKYDRNMDYNVYDTSYNLNTQQYETTKSVLKAAFPSSNLALFHVITGLSYSSPIKDLYPVVDTTAATPTIDIPDTRSYYCAIIGGDKLFREYVVIAVVNKYELYYTDENPYILWLITRDVNPSYETYKKACQDIERSQMNPYTLMSVDHSTNLDTRTTYTREDIDKLVKETTVTKSSTTSVSTDTGGNTVTTSQSSTTESTTKYSSIDVPVNTSFMPKYKFTNCDLVGGMPVFKDLSPTDCREAFSGPYFVSLATPASIYNKGKPGLLNPLFPGCSLMVSFEEFDSKPWDYNKYYLMMDGGLDQLTGEVKTTRTVISSPNNDGSAPYNTFLFQTEGYFEETMEEYTPFDYGSIDIPSPGKLYREKYMAAIVAYKSNSYLGICIMNKIKNRINSNTDKNLVYFFTKDRIIPKSTINDINQEILRLKLELSDLIHIDQSVVIDQFKLEYSYFQMTSQQISSSSSTSSSSSSSGSSSSSNYSSSSSSSSSSSGSVVQDSSSSITQVTSAC